MNTISGKKLNLLDPQPDQIDMYSIARGLANTPHFGGQSHEFFSVAQHSIMVAKRSPIGLYLTGLFHDAAEAYLGDMKKPLKVMFSEYEKIERRLQRVIFEKFDLDPETIPLVKPADREVQAMEYGQFYKGEDNFNCYSPQMAFYGIAAELLAFFEPDESILPFVSTIEFSPFVNLYDLKDSNKRGISSKQ